MFLLRFLVPALVTLALTAPALAGTCAPSTSKPEVDTGPSPLARLYVDDDGSLCEPCAISIWVYAESNGIDGLQRHDHVKDDTCGGQIEGDTIIF